LGTAPHSHGATARFSSTAHVSIPLLVIPIQLTFEALVDSSCIGQMSRSPKPVNPSVFMKVLIQKGEEDTVSAFSEEQMPTQDQINKHMNA